ncbi:MAG: phage major capsid protein, partial [Alphaproteobacteria bacterium]|nr:phage major capsid protein [Alphaproteobacteria bacterium]
MNDKTLSNIEQTIKTLTNTFETFTEKSEKKMNQLYAAKSNFPLSSTDESRPHDAPRSAFKNFLTKGMVSKGLSSDTTSGGYLIPSYVVENIQSQLHMTSSLRAVAQVTEISTDIYDILVDQGDTHVGWAAETQERADTDLPELKKIQIPTHELYAKPKVS